MKLGESSMQSPRERSTPSLMFSRPTNGSSCRLCLAHTLVRHREGRPSPRLRLSTSKLAFYPDNAFPNNIAVQHFTLIYRMLTDM
jgi:hypothetical protein